MKLSNTLTISTPSKAILLFIMIALLNACVSGANIPQDHYYRLPDINNSIIYQAPVFKGAISIEPIRASGILDERSILYVEGEKQNEIKHYFYHHWIDKPSNLIRHHLISYLETSGAAKVAKTDTLSKTDVSTVSITLLRLERVVSKNGIEAKVMLKINHTIPGMIDTENIYTSQIAVGSTSVYDTVTVFGTGLEKIYSDWLNDAQLSDTGDR